MKNKRSTKNALFSSVLALLLCFSMLLGTTYAWFTDSVTSANNIIKSGDLDVDVYYGDPADEKSVEGVSTLFSDVALWEPGAVAYENLTVVNKGTLALKYQMAMNFLNANYVVDGEYSLDDILQVGVVEGGLDDTLTRDEVIASVTEWKPLKSFQLADSSLLANTPAETLGVVIYWEPGSNDNLFNVKNGKVTSDGADYLHIDLGITLLATQMAYESDSFDEKYDEGAEYPEVVVGTLDAGATEPLRLNVGNVTVTVPVGAPTGSYKLEVSSFETEVDADGNTNVDTDFSLSKDGTKVVPDAATYQVELQIDIMSKIMSLKHKGEDIAAYNYDKFTGVISFETTSFSPFSVEYDVFGTEVVLGGEDGRQIQHGFFEGVNPATLDESLLGDDSEYIAVDYVKNGVTYYAVSERATTIILDDGAEAEYIFENDNCSDLVQTGVAGKLYRYFDEKVETSVPKDGIYSTVYLLPGTYNEETRITVSKSMDIIGLGDAEDIKIVKVTGSSKNQHLFNCAGMDDYIQVTFRNLYLNATAKNWNSTGKLKITDNAAIQSIRKTKVKCYDLIIDKTSGCPFYVNANNTAGDGSYNPAYMYVENTMTNSSASVLSHLGKKSEAYFTHFGLTYSSGAAEYTKNETVNNWDGVCHVANEQMAWNDWDWEN